MMTCIFARRAYSIEMCQSFIVEWLLNEGGGQLLPNWMKLCYTVFSLGSTNLAKRSKGNKQIFQYGRFNSSYFVYLPEAGSDRIRCRIVLL